MIEYKQAILKPTKFKCFQITKDLFHEIVKDTERANDRDLRLEEPVNGWKVIEKYHGLVYEEHFGLHFLQDYGTLIQTTVWNVNVGDYIVESSNGHTRLIKEAEFKRNFKVIK